MQLAPGQITDDGEMTLCCARGLANCVAGFEIEKIAAEYKEWVLSPPFDMGITIGASIGCVLKGQHSTAFKKHLEQVGYAKGERGIQHVFILSSQQ